MLASSARSAVSVDVTKAITAVGGLQLIGLGVNILEIKNIKVSNMLPSLLIAALLAHVTS